MSSKFNDSRDVRYRSINGGPSRHRSRGGPSPPEDRWHTGRSGSGHDSQHPHQRSNSFSPRRGDDRPHHNSSRDYHNREGRGTSKERQKKEDKKEAISPVSSGELIPKAQDAAVEVVHGGIVRPVGSHAIVSQIDRVDAEMAAQESLLKASASELAALCEEGEHLTVMLSQLEGDPPKQPSAPEEPSFESSDVMDLSVLEVAVGQQEGDDDVDDDVDDDDDDNEEEEEYEPLLKKRGRPTKRVKDGSCVPLRAPRPQHPPALQRVLIAVGAAAAELDVHDRTLAILEDCRRTVAKEHERLLTCVAASCVGRNEMNTEQGMAHPVLTEIFETRLPRPPPGVTRVLKAEFQELLLTHVDAAVSYRTRFESFRKRAAQKAALDTRRAAAAAAATAANAGELVSGASLSLQQPTSPSMGRRGRSGDIVRSDLEEKQAIATLQAIELVKHMVDLPAQTLHSPRAARWVRQYKDYNRLVEDPVAEERYRSSVRPWTEDEKRLFMERFLVHHKDFGRILPHLPGRSMPELIQLFYRIQRSDEFSHTRRKYQMRKRREKVEENTAQRANGIMGMMGIAELAPPPIQPLVPQHTVKVAQQAQQLTTVRSRGRPRTATVSSPSRPLEPAGSFPPVALTTGPRTARQRSTHAALRTVSSGGELSGGDDDSYYVEAVRRCGKNWKALSRAIGKTESAVRLFWNRHNERLGLDIAALQCAEDGECVRSPMISLPGLDSLTALIQESDTLSGQRPEEELMAAARNVVSPFLATQYQQHLQPDGALWMKLGPEDASEACTLLENPEQLLSKPELIKRLVNAASDLGTASTPAAVVAAQTPGDKKRPGRPPAVWSDSEKEAFLVAYQSSGPDWGSIQLAIPSKSVAQLKNYHRSNRLKLGLEHRVPSAKKVSKETGKAGSGHALGSPSHAVRSPNLQGQLSPELASALQVSTQDVSIVAGGSVETSHMQQWMFQQFALAGGLTAALASDSATEIEMHRNSVVVTKQQKTSSMFSKPGSDFPFKLEPIQVEEIDSQENEERRATDEGDALHIKSIVIEIVEAVLEEISQTF